MSVHLDPRATPVRTPDVGPMERPAASGLSETPSTLQGPLSGNEPQGGLCAWISQMISQLFETIKRWFSPAAKTTPVESTTAPTFSPEESARSIATTTTSALSRHQIKVAKGREIIDAHFNDLSNRNLSRCGVVMLIAHISSIEQTATTGTAVPHAVISTPMEKEAFKAECYRQMEAVVAQNPDLVVNVLTVTMKVIKREPNDTFEFSKCVRYFQFERGESNSIAVSTSNHSMQRVREILQYAFPPYRVQEGRRIGEAVTNGL